MIKQNQKGLKIDSEKAGMDHYKEQQKEFR